MRHPSQGYVVCQQQGQHLHLGLQTARPVSFLPEWLPHWALQPPSRGGPPVWVAGKEGKGMWLTKSTGK